MKFILYKIHLKNPIGEEQQRLIYVGMTTNLISRKSVHKYACTNENSSKYNFNVYKNIRENGGWDAFCIEAIEELECETRLEASKRERYWHDYLGAHLNTQLPNRNNIDSSANYKAEHRAEIKLYKANYYIKKKQLKQEPIV
jgi:hypothetical protein